MVCIIDNNGVDIGNIQPRFDNRSCYQYIVIAFNKIEHHPLQFCSFHLPVCDCNTDVGHNAMDHSGDFHYVLHARVDKKDLSAPRDFVLNSITYHLFVERVNLCLNRETVWRSSVDNREIAGPHQRKLKGPGNRGGCECQCIYIHPELFDSLFGRNAELLLFIDNE